jgi:hypothetical protein
MPVSFFKTHSIKTGAWSPVTVFHSSGTTAENTSKHFIFDLPFYLGHSEKCFEYFFGPLAKFHFMALLPSYLERQNSSLVAMIDHFIKKSGSSLSGFYLYDTEKLLRDLARSRNGNRKTVLFGVTYALLQLAESVQCDLSHCIIIETGGMKGRRTEITRPELHQKLKNAFNVSAIYSEYGMTELLSQAYSDGFDSFRPSPWMKIVGRDLSDPLTSGLLRETCGINVIDLANWHSAAFIATEDLGKVYEDGSFEILGRIDNSDVRGCNLLLQ